MSALFEIPPIKGSGRLYEAASKAIQARRAAGVLTEAHALTEATVLDLAAACDRGLAAPRVTIATTTMIRELRETMAALPDPPVVTDEVAQFRAELDALDRPR